MADYKTYKVERYLFFWLSIAVYFVPYIIVAACLLPFMETVQGVKWGIGLSVAALNALPFLGGILKGFRAHFPFVNLMALVFVSLAGFFTLNIFQKYVATFLWIELAAVLGSVAACVLWHFHKKYKRKAQTVNDVIKSGLVQTEVKK